MCLTECMEHGKCIEVRLFYHLAMQGISKASVSIKRLMASKCIS